MLNSVCFHCAMGGGGRFAACDLDIVVLVLGIEWSSGGAPSSRLQGPTSWSHRNGVSPGPGLEEVVSAQCQQRLTHSSWLASMMFEEADGAALSSLKLSERRKHEVCNLQVYLACKA